MIFNRVINKIEAVKRRLYSMEAMAAEDVQTTAKIRYICRIFPM